MEDLGLEVEIIRKNIDSDDKAQSERFVGSPTIRINGRDIDPAADDCTSYCRLCRIYWIDGGFLGWPSRSMLEEAILAAKDKQG